MPTESEIRKGLQVLGLTTVLAVLLLLFGFGSTPASGNLVASPWDKLAHLGVFATLAIGLRALLPHRPWPQILLLATGVAVADELHQFLVPTRHPSWDDGMSDLAGAACGLLVWWGLARTLSNTRA